MIKEYIELIIFVGKGLLMSIAGLITTAVILAVLLAPIGITVRIIQHFLL